MNIIKKYISGLKNAYIENGGQEELQNFEQVIHGASNDDINSLKQLYPDIPDSLIDLLLYVDGTYWREYKGEEIAFYLLGSDVYEYPYYLLSVKQIIENQYIATEYYKEYINREYEEVEIDEKITSDIESVNWLHFSDCMNNGGASRLFIDFSPSTDGKKGQIVRFLHDPDEFKVIANSFDEYLNQIIKNEYDFIIEDYFD